MGGDALRPGIEIIDVIAHVAAVAAVARTFALAAHLLELAGAEPEIESRLLGRKKRTSLPGTCGAGDIVIHGDLVASDEAPQRSRSPLSCPMSAFRQRLEKR